MINDAEYHEMREAQERVIASSLPDGEPRERHLALADRHADRAWVARNGKVSDPLDGSDRPASRSITDQSSSQAIHHSRELLARSHRILAKSYRDLSAKG